MSAPPRSATPAGASSRRSGCGTQIAPEAAAIRAIHVSDAGRFGFARLQRRASRGSRRSATSWPTARIGAALWERSRALPSSTLRVPARAARRCDRSPPASASTADGRGQRRERVAARLVVAADGAHSQIARGGRHRRATVEDYAQVAVVANVADRCAARGHRLRALHRRPVRSPCCRSPTAAARSSGPAAPERAPRSCSRSTRPPTSPAAGALRLARRTLRARRPPRLLPVEAHARRGARWRTRTVLIGNAAQALHPVAGQGFNLGLRDAAMLAEVIAQRRRRSGRAAAARSASPRGARRTARGVVRFTDSLVKLFGDARPGVAAAAQPRAAAVRSGAAGQERAGARQRRLWRPSAAPRARAAGACQSC